MNTTPLNLIRRRVAIARLNSKPLFERMFYGHLRPGEKPWLRVVPNEVGKQRRETLIDSSSIDEAIGRLLRGEMPPPLPTKKGAAQ